MDLDTDPWHREYGNRMLPVFFTAVEAAGADGRHLRLSGTTVCSSFFGFAFGRGNDVDPDHRSWSHHWRRDGWRAAEMT